MQIRLQWNPSNLNLQQKLEKVRATVSKGENKGPEIRKNYVYNALITQAQQDWHILSNNIRPATYVTIE